MRSISKCNSFSYIILTGMTENECILAIISAAELQTLAVYI